MSNITEKIMHLRMEYAKGQLDEHSVDANPFAEFRLWFEQAMDASGNPNVGASDNGSDGPAPDFADSFFGSIGMKPQAARN